MRKFAFLLVLIVLGLATCLTIYRVTLTSDYLTPQNSCATGDIHNEIIRKIQAGLPIKTSRTLNRGLLITACLSNGLDGLDSYKPTLLERLHVSSDWQSAIVFMNTPVFYINWTIWSLFWYGLFYIGKKLYAHTRH